MLSNQITEKLNVLEEEHPVRVALRTTQRFLVIVLNGNDKSWTACMQEEQDAFDLQDALWQALKKRI